MPDVTVAVPVKDRKERMLRCLDALLAQDHPSFEVLVLDNESTDGSAEACVERANGSGVAVRVERVAGTIGRVRNRAAEVAEGRYIAFTDSDCLPEPGWLSTAVAALEADPALGAVQGTVLPEVEPDQGWPATQRITEPSGRYETCNMVYRREALTGSDGFDETGGMWEDTAGAYAVMRENWRIGWVPEAVVRHDVTYPGYRFHLRRAQDMVNAASVVRRYPEMRRQLLFARVFLRPRNAKFVAALAGLVLGRRHPLALALALPYVEMRLRPWPGTRGLTQDVLLDSAMLVALVRGSVRHRSLVL